MSEDLTIARLLGIPLFMFLRPGMAEEYRVTSIYSTLIRRWRYEMSNKYVATVYKYILTTGPIYELAIYCSNGAVAIEIDDELLRGNDEYMHNMLTMIQNLPESVTKQGTINNVHYYPKSGAFGAKA